MAALGGRVTTYGKKKTQIISVHSDISHPTQGGVPPSPLPKVAHIKRPVLQTKLSNDITNLPATPLPASKVKGKAKAKIIEESPTSSPEIVFKARRVNRPGKVVIPKSPASSSFSPSPIKSVRKVPEVVIPRKSNAGPVKSKSKPKTVGDLSRRFKEIITIEDSLEPTDLPVPSSPVEDPQIALGELLQACSSSTVYPFSDFLISGELPKYDNIKKVGEASYSEVFGLSSKGDAGVKHVVKVIPLLSAQKLNGQEGSASPMPDCSRVQDVKREIEVTKRMSQVPGGGFVEYIGSYVVEGSYPDKLLEEWDLYKSTEGSASVRPSLLPPSQKYCLLVLCHAGTDLESFRFSQSTGWAQAAGIFWQLVFSLSRAEEWTQFEHRDLHEGQILIHPRRPSDEGTTSTSNGNGKDGSKEGEVENYLDPSTSGLGVTIIDFGLSRLTLPNQSESVWTVFPGEVYEGKGAQWDLYRSMRDKIESSKSASGQGGWKGFNPITNVMWLHYILRYTLSKLRAPKPPTRRSSRLNLIYQKEERAFIALNAMEKLLLFSVGFDNGHGATRRRGLRGEVEYTEEDMLESSGDVLSFGEDEGWINTSRL
ncbi:uncharacterized protein I303_105478 [Kwoniella dejecticola CBS 10117]|uniref:non-specific serine/threonine protein kinase n=1 Tax=Kwoniella dejecticola CBS 10117 TaxID=1296121 RepID=A0A1A6A2D6_9TREE|nr:HASPIN protein kinase [Kwoniella dejecticola CBS 10117]OBR84223.1 HASPIN protein kinase [Kwoniella dejecticola CBS 10117]